jgi:hypothetical protein
MSYLYEVSFNVDPKALSKEKLNIPLEKVLGYMKPLFPSQKGWMDARAFFSLNEKNNTYVVCISEWEYWEDLENHRKSNLSEDKVLEEFGPHIKEKDLIIRIFEEVD